jgi:hypothetical protein
MEQTENDPLLPPPEGVHAHPHSPSVLRRRLGYFFLLIVVLAVYGFIVAILALLVPLPPSVVPCNQKIGVGIDLSASYGTVAISSEDGIVNVAKLYFSSTYGDILRKLDGKPSTHRSDPFNYAQEVWGVRWRRFRKRLGLPAHEDVRVFASIIRGLHAAAETYTGQEICSVLISIINVSGIFDNDISDALEYLNLARTKPLVLPAVSSDLQSMQPLGAWYGYNNCLCPDWRGGVCEHIPYPFPIFLHYTSEVFLAQTKWGFQMYTGPKVMELGSDARQNYENKTEYWEAIRGITRNHVPSRGQPIVVFTGESASDEKFQKVIEEVCFEQSGEYPKKFDSDPIWIVARGNAEAARRSLWLDSISMD